MNQKQIATNSNNCATSQLRSKLSQNQAHEKRLGRLALQADDTADPDDDTTNEGRSKRIKFWCTDTEEAKDNIVHTSGLLNTTLKQQMLPFPPNTDVIIFLTRNSDQLLVNQWKAGGNDKFRVKLHQIEFHFYRAESSQMFKNAVDTRLLKEPKMQQYLSFVFMK